jgi:cytochrome c-type biogenesis protein CcmH/NrfG
MSTEPSDDHGFRDPIWIGVSLILLLHFITSLWPGVAFWGIDYWSEFPLPYRIVILVAGLLLAFPSVGARISAWVTGVQRPRVAVFVATGVLAGLMIVFRSRALAYGDAYSILAVIRNPEIPQLIGNLRFQPLDLYLHWTVFQYIVSPLGGTVELTYAMLGAICGVAGIAAIVRIARAVTTDRSQRLFVVMCGLTSGCVFLWFGHVESYTMAMTASLWVIALLVRSKEHHQRPALAWVCWMVAVASHALSIVLLPALVWGSWKTLRRRLAGMRIGQPRFLLIAGFVTGVIAAAIGHLLQLQTFVPLFPTANNNYFVVSWAHLADVLNLVLFAAPLVVLLPFALLRESHGSGPNDTNAVLGLAVLGLGLFAFWIDPMLGGFRDWDLLGAFGIPLSLLCGSIVIRRLGTRWRNRWIIPVAVLALAHSGAWVAANQEELKSAMRVDRLVREDAHYSKGYYQGERRAVWAQSLTNQLEKHALAGEHFIYHLKYDPNDAVTWANLGIAYQHRRLMDSALASYGMAMKTDQNNPLYALAYGQVEHSMGRFQLARVALERAADLAPGLYEAQMALGMVYFDLRMLDEAEERAHLALQLDSERPDANRLLGDIAELRGEPQ